MGAKVTVIIPMYHAARTIGKCLQSIRAQTVSDWVAYVIDDGSVDDGLKICKEIAEADSRIRVFSKENGGASAARNYGIERTETPYFVFVDSDDFIEPGYLETLLDTQEKYPQIGSVWAGYRKIYPAENRPEEVYAASREEKYSFLKQSQIMELYQNQLLNFPWQKLYRTQIVQEKCIRMDETIIVGEDLVFNLDYLDALDGENIVVINEPVYNYVMENANSLVHKFQPTLLSDVEKWTQRLKACMLKWGSEKADFQMYYNSCFWAYDQVLTNTYHPSNPESAREKLRFNNTIMRSPVFKELLRKMDCSVHPLLFWAYKSGSYRNILRVNKLVKLKMGVVKKW